MTPSRAVPPLLLALGIAGYPLVAASTTLLGLDNRPAAIGLRLLMILLSFTVIGESIVRPSRTVRTLPCLPIFAFWILYASRIAIDGYLRPGTLSLQPSEYWMWALGGCLIPATALLIRTTPDQMLLGMQRSFALAGLACLLVLCATALNVSAGLSRTLERGRLELLTLNPISAGHLGGSLVILGIFLTVWTYRRRPSTLAIAISGVGTVIGVIVLVLSASRGPFLATACALLFFAAVASGGGRRAWILLLICCVLLAGYVLAGFVEEEFGFLPVTRVLIALRGYDDPALASRYEMSRAAWEQFLESPLFGSGLEEQATGSYPHNVTIEAFMATGVIGGVSFLLVQLVGLAAAWRVIERTPTGGWVGMLFIQYLIAGQFSGSLWASTTLWILTAAVVAAASQPSERYGKAGVASG